MNGNLRGLPEGHAAGPWVAATCTIVVHVAAFSVTTSAPLVVDASAPSPATLDLMLPIDIVAPAPEPPRSTAAFGATRPRVRTPTAARPPCPSEGPRADREAPPASESEAIADAASPSDILDLRFLGVVSGGGRRDPLGASGSAEDFGGRARGPSGPHARDGGSHARAVRLRTDRWDCPWPRDADGLAIDEQVVRLRVVVAANGAVLSAEVLSDPGYGFREQAIACARDPRNFLPAKDDRGRHVVATSPIIEAKFTR